MISKWEYVDKVFPKGKTEDRLVQAISDSLVESLFNDDMFDDDEYNIYDKILFDYVNLDLPSGIKWATCNIGADKPEELGLLFQWGRTDGYKYDDKHHNFLTGDDYVTTSDTKYNKKEDILKPEDDAAYQATKGKFRMPTKDEIDELLKYTDNEWTELNGVNGRKFISKKDDSKWIFIPAAGKFLRDGGSFCGAGMYFNVWSASVSYKDCYAYRLFCSSSDCVRYDNNHKDNGYSVRGVLNN